MNGDELPDLEGVCKDKASSEESKPDIACKSIYPALARAVMFDLHENEMEMLERSLSGMNSPRNVVVVGPGSEVLPFSENLETVVRMLNGGNMILMDYNAAICDKMPDYLREKGFGEAFSIVRATDDVDVSEARNTIFVVNRDIREGYNLPENSISAIDMTVAVHHATQYEVDIVNFGSEAHRVLQPGGILHIGEGDVDMKYSERKTLKIAEDLTNALDRGLMIQDERCQDAPSRGRYFNIGNENPLCVFVSPTGMVSIPYAPAYDVLQRAGYKQIALLDGRNVVLPLIDHAMEEDFQGMIVPVREYYRRIAETGLPRLDKDKHEAFWKALAKEQSDAERGLVEYYSPPAMVCNSLRKAGFSIEEARYTKHGPFVNILARARK